MKGYRSFLLIIALLGAVGFLGGFWLGKPSLTSASDKYVNVSDAASGKSDWVVVRIYYTDQTQLDSLANSLDIWEAHPEQGYAVIAVSPAQRQWLELNGLRIELDLEKTAWLDSPAAPLDPRYYYFDSNYPNPNGRYLVTFLQNINSSYPALTELVDIGNAWQADHGGHLRDMWVLRITNEDPAYGDIAAKPAFFLMAEIHAREVATPELAIRYIQYLTSGFEGLGGYGVDADVTWMVNHHVIYVLPMQNPDGHVPNEQSTGAYRRKNMDNDDGCIAPNPFGVDLNRNHSFLWGCCGGSSDLPCAETYRGPNEASEPETQAYQDYVQTVISDANGPNDNWTIAPASPITTTGVFISLHSYADEILWPWYLTGYPPAPNQDQMEDIGRKFASINGFYPSGSIGYTVDGAANYWTYGILGIPSFTFEVGPDTGSCGGFFPQYGCIDGIDGMPRDFWAENRPVFIYATKIARQPYLIANGPDAQNLAVDPASVTPGEPITLTAVIADHRYGSDPLAQIAGGEYFFDAPGVDGTGFPMSPSDGSWGSTSEAVQALVDTTGLSPGQHYLLVHGKSTQDIWGPLTAIFIEVLPLYDVSLTPGTIQGMADPGTAHTYTLQINNLGLNTDSYDITVQSYWQALAPASLGPLPGGGSAAFDVVVSVPLTATHGESDQAVVTARSQAMPSISATAVMTTTAKYFEVGVSPEYDAQSADPGAVATYVLQVTNLGNQPDIYTFQSSSIWEVSLPAGLGPLAPGESGGITVTVSVPPEALAGASDTATIQVIPSSPGTPPAAASLTTTANAIYAVQLLADPGAQLATHSGVPITYTVTLTNTGNITDSFSLALSSIWIVEYPASVGPLAPGAAVPLQIVVHVPAAIRSGVVDTAILSAVSVGDPLKSGSTSLTTTTLWVNLFLPALLK